MVQHSSVYWPVNKPQCSVALLVSNWYCSWNSCVPGSAEYRFMSTASSSRARGSSAPRNRGLASACLPCSAASSGEPRWPGQCQGRDDCSRPSLVTTPRRPAQLGRGARLPDSFLTGCDFWRLSSQCCRRSRHGLRSRDGWMTRLAVGRRVSGPRPAGRRTPVGCLARRKPRQLGQAAGPRWGCCEGPCSGHGGRLRWPLLATCVHRPAG